MNNSFYQGPTNATIVRGASPPNNPQSVPVHVPNQSQMPIMRNTVPTPGSMPVNPAPKQSAVQQVKKTRTVFIDRTTKNKSFLDMSNYLKAIGVKNNSFMLTIVDPDLIGVDPFDPKLSGFYKQKVLRECMVNYWYFLREVARIPDQGGRPVRFKLTRANLAVNFCMSLNLNIFEEVPRQQGKTVSAAVRYLYVYNFGTTNSKIAFLHKNMEGSKSNIQTLKDIRDLLPNYLIMKEMIAPDGKVIKGTNKVTEMKNPHNNNIIKAFASATNKAKAASLLRGLSLTSMWFDEYGFLPYNDIIYMNAMPAFKTASMNAKRNGSPYGILITTTPGFMSTPEGKEAYATKEAATKFSEKWYDLSYAELMELINANTKSNFVYIKFTYQQLGCSEEWFNEICKDLKNSYPDIRREILLEWATGVENSPFKEEDLDTISKLVVQPISQVYLLNKYLFETYWQTDTRTFPPIIGVDVSGGMKQDSSTITIIDSRTTKVLGCLNCNYISIYDLAKCIEFIVKSWMPNAVINVERNGVGIGVISNLAKLGLKRNMYYEIKDVVTEERQDGVHAYKQKVRTKVFGLQSTKSIRALLIDILMERVENHKDKIMSPIIYNELLGMEIKRNGKVEHSDSTHDDQVFSMLMALYVWYEGVNLGERYGIRKTSIRTDDDIDEQLGSFDNDTVEIMSSFNQEDDLQNDIEQDLNAAIAAGGMQMKDFVAQEEAKDRAAYNELMQTPLGQKAYREKYNIPDHVSINIDQDARGDTVIPDSVFLGFYNDDGTNYFKEPNNLTTSQNPYDLEDDEYSYTDHFNF